MNGFNKVSPSQIANVYLLTSGDNTSGLQAAINAAIASGTPLYVFGSGSCSSSLTINGACAIYGAGKGVTNLTLGGNPGISITTTSPVTIRGMSITCSTAGMSCILVQPASGENSQSSFVDLSINGPTSGGTTALIGFIRASGWTILNCGFWANSNNSILVAIQNQNNADSGDSSIVPCEFWSNNIAYTGTTGVYWESSGGQKITNSKFNGLIQCVEINLASGAATVDFLFHGNSCENYSYAFVATAAGSTGSFGNLQIIANQFAPYSGVGGVAIYIEQGSSSSAAWLSGVIINGNIFIQAAASSDVINLSAGTFYMISGNTFYSSGGTQTCVSGSSGATYGVCGPNMLGGTSMATASFAGTGWTKVTPT